MDALVYPKVSSYTIYNSNNAKNSRSEKNLKGGFTLIIVMMII